MAISFANPYHMLVLRMIKTMVNAYTLNEYTVPAVISMITGKSEFKGVSPVEPLLRQAVSGNHLRKKRAALPTQSRRFSVLLAKLILAEQQEMHHRPARPTRV